MDDRKQRVLRAIVSLYSTEGEPVGSSLLAQHFGQAVSSATLRNEMAALTKLGLLEQPHTSAGRVPSAKGYRYYLDNLMDVPPRLSVREQQMIDKLFRGLDYDPERLAQGAAEAMADLTGYAAAATTPRSDDACIAHFEVVQVGRFTAAVLAVSNAGGVQTRTAKLDFELQPQDVQSLAATLNEHLTFRSAADVDPALLHTTVEGLGEHGITFYPVISAAYTLLKAVGKPKVFLEGQRHLLSYRSLDDSFRMLMDLFGDEEAVKRYINPASQRTTVLLGDDLQDYPMPGFCIMMKQYVAGGGRTGVIGVVGPTRMPYRSVMPQLEYFALLLGRCMAGNTQEG